MSYYKSLMRSGMPSHTKKFDQVGFRYKDFEVIRSIEVHELHCHLYELVHLPTSAHIMHIANDDPENLFCLSFQTLPDNSDGVAHILEHTVLCGSKKYPVKDPFFGMTRRSLNTFMNALTGSDFTCYPAATQINKDFYNLLEVYLDAVFHPNLKLYSFLQEGHRLEFAQPNDPTSPLEFKGVVYNEMKGAMASASARLHEVLDRELFPDITYGFNSGGNPKEIPSLTYEKLQEFHKTYYHPSRCLFFFYGNFPLEPHLDFIDQHTLQHSSKIPPLPPLPLQPRFKTPKVIHATYPIAQDEKTDHKTHIAFGWLTCHILHQEELLALSILEALLLDTDASPLKKALLKSGLCKQVSSYIDTELSEAPFSITLRGCNPDDAPALKELVYRTLEQVVRQGVPLHNFENALHQMEFHRSEINGDSGPFGLSLFMRSALLKQHGASSEQGLHIHKLIDELRKRNLADPYYFTNLIRYYLLNNTHAVQVIMQPDKDLAGAEKAEERSRLDALQSSLSAEDAKELIDQAAKLTAFQALQEEEDLDVLPTMTLEDVPVRARDFELIKEMSGKLQVFHHATFTNGIIYADLIYDLPEIAEEDLPYVRLFAHLLSQMGCGERSYSENLEYIQANTGGVGASMTFNLNASDPTQFHPSFYIRGKALHRKASNLFEIFADMAKNVDFHDVHRLREVIMKHFTALQSSLNQNALKYAINLSASSLDIPSKIANDWYGLNYFWKIKELSENFDQDAPNLQLKLQQLHDKLLCLENPHLVVTCDAEMYNDLKTHHFYGLADLPEKPFKPWKGDYKIETVIPQGRIIPSPVAFTAIVVKTVPYTHHDAPALNIAAYLCDNLVLHAKLREQGGAYGGGAVCNSMASNFYFYAYRDPNISSTLAAFKEAIEEVAAGEFDEEDLEAAKLEMIQSLDTPVSPGSRGDLAYGWMREGKPQHCRQEFRNMLLAATSQDVIDAVKAHLIPNFDSGIMVSFANKELLEKENALLATADQVSLKLEPV